MKQASEIEEIRAALKRAAYKAVHGTREERSGRFLRPEKPRETPLDSKSKRSGEDRHKAKAAGRR